MPRVLKQFPNSPEHLFTPIPTFSCIVLVFFGILRAPLECYHNGLVCVLTEFSGLR